MTYKKQLSAARFRAERDMARQELDRAKEELGKLHSDAIARFVVEQSMKNTEREIKLGVNSIAESLGIKDEIQELPIAEVCPRIVAEMERRLMPMGCEWPRYEDGEPVQFGDETNLTDAVESITFDAYGTTLIGDKHGDFDAKYVQGVKRHIVLAADGEPLREGETVWDVDGRGPLTVWRFPEKSGMYVSLKKDGTFYYRYPEKLTHERPVNHCFECSHWQAEPGRDRLGVCWDTYGERECEDSYAAVLGTSEACAQFERRAKALAERGEQE